MQNDPEIQLDLRTDELSKHLIRPETEEEEDDEKELSEEEEDSDKKGEDEIEEAENAEDQDEDEFESDDEDNKEPKILITTHDLKVSLRTYKLCRELAKVLPNAQYFYRKRVRLSKIIPEAIKRKYSAIIVINQDRKEPSN